MGLSLLYHFTWICDYMCTLKKRFTQPLINQTVIIILNVIHWYTAYILWIKKHILNAEKSESVAHI